MNDPSDPKPFEMEFGPDLSPEPLTTADLSYPAVREAMMQFGHRLKHLSALENALVVYLNHPLVAGDRAALLDRLERAEAREKLDGEECQLKVAQFLALRCFVARESAWDVAGDLIRAALIPEGGK